MNLQVIPCSTYTIYISHNEGNDSHCCFINFIKWAKHTYQSLRKMFFVMLYQILRARNSPNSHSLFHKMQIFRHDTINVMGKSTFNCRGCICRGFCTLGSDLFSVIIPVIGIVLHPVIGCLHDFSWFFCSLLISLIFMSNYIVYIHTYSTYIRTYIHTGTVILF